MHLSVHSISQILNLASPHIKRDTHSEAFSLLCTVEGGIACRFSTSDWTDASLNHLSEAIIDEVGWKVIEHSARREVLIRCTVPDAQPAKALCTIDRGDGPQPLPVQQEAED
jgi:hypothetical protein